MFYYLFYPLRDIFFGFNVFRYITFRAAMAAVTSFLFCIIFGPLIIKQLRHFNIVENIHLQACPPLQEQHKAKEGTLTMGGIIILLGVITSVLLWADIKNSFILLTLLICVWLGIIGFIDDFIKHSRKESKGLTVKTKLFWQVLLGLFIGIVIYLDPDLTTKLHIPFLKKAIINLGVFYILFALLVIVGSSNAVNLTDGLDGLAIGCTTMVALSLAVLSYVSGHAVFSQYLLVPFISGSGELTVFCMAIAGAGLGFLWFNCHPAIIFMGDVGSLALGGTLGAIAVFIKKELLLILVGGIFVAEAISVIIQVLSFKFRGKRVFKAAPLHHHFQIKGQPESRIIIRFWIIAIILVLISLLALKLR